MLPVFPEWSVIFELKITSPSEKVWGLERRLSIRAQPRMGMTIKKDGILYSVTDEFWDDDRKAFIVEQTKKISDEKAQDQVDAYVREGWQLKIKPKRKAEDATVSTKEDKP